MRQKVIHSLVKMASVGTLAVISLMLVVSAKAQCGGSFETLVKAIASTKGQFKLAKFTESVANSQNQLVNDKAVNTSIVGLWRIKFIIDTPGGPATFQEAFQIWNTGGTEVHNPKVD